MAGRRRSRHPTQQGGGAGSPHSAPGRRSAALCTSDPDQHGGGPSGRLGGVRMMAATTFETPTATFDPGFDAEADLERVQAKLITLGFAVAEWLDDDLGGDAA